MSITKTIQQMVDALASIANEPDRTLQQRPVRFAKAKEAIQSGRVLLESIAKQEQGEPVVWVNIKCETSDGNCIGSVTLNVIRVEREDDGTVTAVTDYWPSAAQSKREPLTDEQIEDRVLSDVVDYLSKQHDWLTKISAINLVAGLYGRADKVLAAHGTKE